MTSASTPVRSAGSKVGFAEPVALALEEDHGGVVDEPVDEGGGPVSDTLAKLANRPERPS
jgi:hypothetical protein